MYWEHLAHQGEAAPLQLLMLTRLHCHHSLRVTSLTPNLTRTLNVRRLLAKALEHKWAYQKVQPDALQHKKRHRHSVEQLVMQARQH